MWRYFVSVVSNNHRLRKQKKVVQAINLYNLFVITLSAVVCAVLRTIFVAVFIAVLRIVLVVSIFCAVVCRIFRFVVHILC